MLNTKDGPIWFVMATVGSGAALGAILRWALSYLLNSKWAFLPLGTLTANILGGCLIGVALGWFGSHPSLSPAVRLFIVTGFLGGLTTFSTFSSENVAMLMRGDLFTSLCHISLHLLGSLFACWGGMQLYRNLIG